MAHAETCPLCKGTGIKNGQGMLVYSGICHGCDGKGWVSVQDDANSNTDAAVHTAFEGLFGESPKPTPGYDYLRYAGFNSTTVV